MGNTDTKFKGPGKVLGTGEVVTAPKRKSLFTSLGASAPSSTSSGAPKPSPAPASKPKSKVALNDAEKEERRKTAAAAAISRERAWEERIARQRTRREQEESSQLKPNKAWNEGSIVPQNLPPADPEVLRRQNEAAAALEKSGFNPYQATVASAGTARSIMAGGPADPSTKAPHPDSNVSVETMQKARSQLKLAMQGSDIAKLTLALQEAEKYEVPEIEEAQDLLTALINDAPSAPGEDEDVEEAARSEVLMSILVFERTPDTAERKAATVAILQTLLRNLLDHPEEAKYRKIRLENKAIKDKIVDTAQGTSMGILEAVGFRRLTDEDGKPCLMVPDPAILSIEIVLYARKSCELALQRLAALKF